MKLFQLILAALCAAVNVNAQVTPPTVTPPAELPMIMSSGALRTYALNRATEVNANLSSASIANSNDTYASVTWTGSKTIPDIIAKIDSLRVRGDTVNTADIVSFYLSVNSTDGEQLFYGYKEVFPVQTNGVWALPASVRNIVMNMGYGVSIVLGKQVSSADIVSKDANGNTRFNQLAANGTKIFFPVQSAGLPNAYVRISWQDGTSTSYNIADGKARVSVPLEASALSSFANVKFATSPSIVTLVVPSVRGVGVVPTFEVTTTVVSNVVFDITTSEGKRPVKFWSKTMNGTSWSMSSATTTGGTSVIVLPVGVSYVVPEWNTADFNEAPIPVSTGGNSG